MTTRSWLILNNAPTTCWPCDQLVASGFPDKQVFLLHDKAEKNQYLPMKRNVEKQLDLVLGLLEKDDLVVVAFSGHGLQLEHKNYFCPADASLEQPEQSLISIDAVYQRLTACGFCRRSI